MGPGENAGAVDVGGGLAVAFKVESHNHPSAVEPFQGAATGVGGILRDIFALGARPIAVLDSLRFGEPDASGRSRYLLDHAVAGIGHYGNSIGVPTIGGEVYFEAPYEQSCLVNAMALGLAETDRMIRSAAAGVGNVVVLFGASTGRDGIGGASVLASAELDEADGDKRPTVQVGDPFAEKKLMECSLELLDRGLLVSLQDLGAAGLTSSASEMASKGGVGIDLDVARVPLREADMEPFEIMVSESQERMMCVCEPARLDDVLAVCARWEVHGTAIGEVTDSGAMRIFRGDELVGDMPVAALVDDCPVYELAPQRPGGAALRPARGDPRARRLGARGAARAARLAQPRLAPAAVRAVRLDRAVAHRPPPRGGRRRGARAARRRRPRRVDRRQRPARGRRPLPGDDRGDARVRGQPRLRGRRAARRDQQPQLRQPREAAHRLAAHRGRARPGRRLQRPRRAGHRRQRLALQRERHRPDLPDAGHRHGRPPARRASARAASASRARATRSRSPAGTRAPSLAGGELAKLWGEPLPDGLPAVDLSRARAVLEAVRDAVRAGTLSSCHDVAEGGLLVALAECCLAGGLGASLDLGPSDDLWSELFGERPVGFVLSGPRDALDALARTVPLDVFGTVGGDALELTIAGETSRWALAELREAHGALGRFFP